MEWYIAIQESWKKAGLPVPMTAEQREAVRRRSQFCRVLRSDLDALNKTENWNDQFYTDLEAEVEAHGWYYASRFDSLLRRRSWGLRRVRSLIKAIETSTEQALLLVGEPGSGKSVALRHLAHQLAERGTRSTDLKAKIPLYVNLKELPPPPDSGPCADWIRTFTIDNVRRGDADTADYIKDHWDEHIREGTWFFLFDSFDEIPAVMHAPSGSSIIKDYAEAIRQFLAGMSDCRGILASREFKGPDTLPWQKFRILPLSNERQGELVDNSFLPPPQKEIVRQHLAASTSNLRQNPLFLTLLCRYVKQENRAPTNDHDLLEKHLVRLAERDPEYISKKYKLTPVQLLDGAMELAVLFAMDPQLSLAPTHDQILAALPKGSPIRKKLDLLLAALVDVKIGRSDVQEAKSGDRRFTFSHRRYQESLFVRYLALHPAHVSAHDLLLDLRWREYTVALLQTGTTDAIKPLIEEATRLISDFAPTQKRISNMDGFGRELGYYDWNNVATHLLALLQEGLGRRLDDIPAGLTDVIDKLLSARWEGGDLVDRVLVLRYGGLLPGLRLSNYITFSVQKGIGALSEAAFGSVVFLREIPTSLMQWLRIRISNQIIASTAPSEKLIIEALCARLPTDVNARFLLRRCGQIRALSKPMIRLAKFRIEKEYINQNPPDRVVDVAAYWVGFLSVLVAQRIVAADSVWSLWLMVVEVPLLLALVGYWYRAIPDAGIDNFRPATRFWQGDYFVVYGMGLVVSLLVKPLVGVVGTKISIFVFSLIVGVTLCFLCWIAYAYAVEVRRQKRRFKLLRAQLPPGEMLVLQARSAAELTTWLNAHGDVLLPSEQHCRSLTSLLMRSIDEGGLPPSIKSDPPLVRYLSAENRSHGNVIDVFSHVYVRREDVKPGRGPEKNKRA
ncbi:NACHT domain-containing protein [Archangium gephyra]|uniref:NACHT domain-containing protein n=1 Tax=Archangium gephyra TaxID=48 RepID=UPI0035D45FF5